MADSFGLFSWREDWPPPTNYFSSSVILLLSFFSLSSIFRIISYRLLPVSLAAFSSSSSFCLIFFLKALLMADSYNLSSWREDPLPPTNYFSSSVILLFSFFSLSSILRTISYLLFPTSLAAFNSSSTFCLILFLNAVIIPFDSYGGLEPSSSAILVLSFFSLSIILRTINYRFSLMSLATFNSSSSFGFVLT